MSLTVKPMKMRQRPIDTPQLYVMSNGTGLEVSTPLCGATAGVHTAMSLLGSGITRSSMLYVVGYAHSCEMNIVPLACAYVAKVLPLSKSWP